jgi:hypothetical protein
VGLSNSSEGLSFSRGRNDMSGLRVSYRGELGFWHLVSYRRPFTSGVSTVISSSARGFGLWRRAIVLVPLALAALSFGCGSSSQDTPGTAKEKKEEERYRYEGTGAAKHKVLIRRKDERQKELSEQAKHASEATKN